MLCSWSFKKQMGTGFICTGIIVIIPRLALSELLYGLIFVFTFLHAPSAPTLASLSPGPQAGGVLAGASQGCFVNGTLLGGRVIDVCTWILVIASFTKYIEFFFN